MASNIIVGNIQKGFSEILLEFVTHNFQFAKLHAQEYAVKCTVHGLEDHQFSCQIK